MSKPGPLEIDAILKVFNRLVSAYERSCEIELEKEKVEAELKLGLRRVDLEEKRMNAQFKILMRRIDLEEKKLTACINALGANVSLLERQQQQTFALCDKLVTCSCKTKDPVVQERMLQVVMRMHSEMMGKLVSSADGVHGLLSGAKSLCSIPAYADRKRISHGMAEAEED